MQKHLKKQLVDKQISPEKWVLEHYRLVEDVVDAEDWIESTELFQCYRQCDRGTIDRTIKCDVFIRKVRKALERKYPHLELIKKRPRIGGIRVTVLQNVTRIKTDASDEIDGESNDESVDE